MSKKMSKEIWKDIEGYENMYQVSNLGRVKSLRREVFRKVKKGRDIRWVKPIIVKEKILRQNLTKCGYPVVSLSHKEKTPRLKTFRVHRLVAVTFLGLEDGLEVNHIDEDKLNNSLKNLEWVSRGDNIRHSNMSYSKPGVLNGRSKLTMVQVREIRKRAEENKEFLAKEFGVSVCTVRKIIRGACYAE